MLGTGGAGSGDIGGGNTPLNSGYIKGPNALKNKKTTGSSKKPLKSETDGSTAGGDEEHRDNLSPLEKKHLTKKTRDLNSNFLAAAAGMRDRDFDGPGGYRNMKEP